MRDVAEQLREATTTLICAPSMDGDGADLCHRLLARSGAEGRAVLAVSYESGPDDCVATLPEDADVAGVLLVGDAARDETSPGDVPVEVVPAADDVTALGIQLSRAIAGADDLVVCIDSVSTLLQHVERETAYEFLHTVTRQLYSADARAHLHLDPSAHDRSTVDLFASLCDAVVDLSGDGEPEVRKRPSLE